MRRWLFLVIVGFGSLVVGNGCGYAFAGSTTSLPKGVERIYVPPVQNDTRDTAFTSLLWEALEERVARYGVVEVVGSVTEADAILEVKVLRVRRTTGTSVAANDAALQQSLEVTLFGELRRVTGEVLWRNPSLSVTRGFAVTSSAVVPSSPAFAAGNLTSGQVGALNVREVSRGQEYGAFVQIADIAARNIYDVAIGADF